MGICTDNAAYCKKAWKIVETKYTSDYIFGYGCAAHVLNLLVKDVTNQATTDLILKDSTSIVKEIKKSNILQANLVEIQRSAPVEERVTTTLKLPAQTRWGSSLNCSQSLSVNQSNLKNLAISKVSNRLSQTTKKLILDDEYWIKVQKLIELIQPIVVFLIKIEGDESRMSEIPEIFIELEYNFMTIFNESLSLLTATEAQNVLNSLKSRSNMVLTPLHYAANILDPAYRGNHLNARGTRLGSECTRL